MANLSNINNILRTNSTGVGIFADAGSYPLEISSAGTAGIKLLNTAGATYDIYANASEEFIIAKNGVGNRLVISSGGNATFSGTINSGAITSTGTGTFGGTISITQTSSDFIDLTRDLATDQTWRQAISGSGSFSLYDVTRGADVLILDTTGNATFAGNVLMGNTVVNPASGFANQSGIGLKYSTTVPEIQVSSDNAAMQLGRTTTGGDGQILALRKEGTVITSFNTNASQFYNLTSGQTGTIVMYSEGGGEVGLTVQSRTNRGKIRVADNDSNAYVVAEAGKAFFGTSANGDSSNITVLTSGNVGIGTTSPSSKLTIADSSTGVPVVRLSGFASANSTAYSKLEFYNEDGSGQGPNIAASIKALTGTNSNGSGGALSFSTSTGSGGAGVEATERMRIDSAGTLSIGPDAQDIQIKAASNNSGKNLIYLRGNAVGDKAEISLNHYGHANMFIGMGTTAATVMSLTATSGGIDGIIINTSGDIGIGTATPQKKVHIEGTGAASEMQILVSSASDTVGHTAGIGLRGEGGEADGDFRIKGGIFFERIAGDYGNGKMILAVNSSVSNTSVTVADHAITIDTNKNVGIGTTNPVGRLDIGSSSGTSLQFLYDAGQGYRNNISNYWNSSTDTRMDFNIGRTSGVAPVTVMSVGYGSNVGIGTASPSQKLHIYDGAGGGSAPDSRTKLLIEDNGEAYLAFNVPAASYQGIRFSQAGAVKALAEYYGTANSLHIGTIDSTGTLEFHTTNSVKMTILANGNVGIGTTSPGAKLEVQGSTSSYHFKTLGGTGNSSFGVYEPTGGEIRLYMNNSAGSIVNYLNTNGNSYLNGGNVGIGITSPVARIDAKSTYDYNVTSNGVKSGRVQYSWYTGQVFSNSDAYVHIKTTLWMGGAPSGNTMYIMGGFTAKSFGYGGGTGYGEGSCMFHNWSGSFPGLSVTNRGSWATFMQSPYASTDGYCVIVLRHNYYSTPIIDFLQPYTGYTWREVSVTNTSTSANNTGVY